MGLSVASLKPITTMTYMSSTPQAYSINNESVVSGSYRESIGNTATPDAVRATPPVRYANSRFEIAAITRSNVAMNQKMNQGLNSIASSFDGNSTSYGRDMSVNAYATYGAGFDAIA